LVLLLIISSGIVYYTTIFQPNQRHLQATATAQANATATANQRQMQATATTIASHYPFSDSLALNDPLRHNSDNIWSEVSETGYGCMFTAGAYHAYENNKNTFLACVAKASHFSNFTYEVQMTILKGACGGILFRSDYVNSKYYAFEVCQDGTYHLYLYLDNSHSTSLVSDSDLSINKGLDQSNLLSVVARGQSITLYVNSHPIDHVSDKTYSSGQIGVIADDYGNPTEVVYNNAKVWVL
jgi:hypothetical protein